MRSSGSCVDANVALLVWRRSRLMRCNWTKLSPSFPRPLAHLQAQDGSLTRSTSLHMTLDSRPHFVELGRDRSPIL